MQQLPKNTFLQGGKYKIEKVLGQGGFGITYLATQKISIEGPIGQIETEIKLAIKEFFMKDVCNRGEDSNVVSIPSVGSKQMAERFKQKFIKEAWNISKLKHPHIIKVVDVFEENDTAYYVMEYHGNGSLNSSIKQNGAFSEEAATNYILQIANALDYIHKQQMNHLDIKPDNVLLNNKGEAVLIDFGLSKCYDADGEQTSSTPIGVSVGYAPLEQLRIGGVGTFSPATDIYSLGATFYKLVTGQTPPDASDVLDEGLPDIPNHISRKVQDAIIRAMEPRRKKRPQCIEEFLAPLNSKHRLIDGKYDLNVIPRQDNENNESFNVVENNEDTIILGAVANSNIKPLELKEQKEYIDLGLSVKWAVKNYGANEVYEYGSLLKWHETKDVGYGKWRLPTKLEQDELRKKCRFERASLSGIEGYRVLGSNGNCIFLPFSGVNTEKNMKMEGVQGYYWSDTKNSLNIETSYYLFLTDDIMDTRNAQHHFGMSVRLVYDTLL